jgi:solute carrier family 25 protein 44
VREAEEIFTLKVIEWHMLDMYRFYPFALTCSLTVRGMLYPLSVVKTRMQIQRQNTVYTGGVFRTLHQVYRHEGLPGLYKVRVA